MMTIADQVKFDQKTHFARIPVVFGQWQKSNKPEGGMPCSLLEA